MSISAPSPDVSSRWLAVRERQHALIAEAQCGGDTRNELIMLLYPILKRMAQRFYTRSTFSPSIGRVLEVDDLIHSAIERMLAEFDNTLTKENPVSYLIGVARYTMLSWVSGHADVIKRHASEKAIPVLSLDQPLAESEEDGTMTTLADQIPCEVRLPGTDAARMFELVEQAIAMLPGKQRYVIDRAFGFHEQSPVSLNQIGQELSSKNTGRRTNIAHYHHRRALTTLHQHLTSSFPQYAMAGGAQ